MKARSSENGFDEIRDLFKDDDLDLSCFNNKDLASGYLFDDLITGYDLYNNNNDIQYNDEQVVLQPDQLPSLPLSFGDYDNIPAPPSTTDDLNSTAESGFHAEVLVDQNLLSSEPYNNDDISQNVCLVDGVGEIVDETTSFEAVREKMKDFELCFLQQENDDDDSVPGSEACLDSTSNHQILEPKCADIDEMNQTRDDDKSVSAEIMSLSTPHQETCNTTSRKRKHRVDGEEIGFKESSCSKQALPRDNNYSHSSPKRVRRSVSPPSNRRKEHSNQHRRNRNRSSSRSPSPCRRDSHRMRYSSLRKRYTSSRRSRNSPPAFFRGTGLGKPGSCLFVAGLCFSLSERELARKFSRFGRIRDVRIIRDKRSGRSRGYGFLSLEKSEEADAAIRAIHRTEWNGRMILVEKSVPK